MTTTFAVNERNDLYLDGAGNIAIVSGIQAVLQNCEHIMKTVLAECVLDITIGIPDFQTVWYSRRNLAQYEFAARKALAQVEGVVNVLQFNSDIVDDVLVYQATILTIFGEGIL